MSCVDCNHIVIKSDPDPHDWFCDDDVKAQCKLVLDENTGEHKLITVACRPHRIRKECETPDWCPLLNTPKKV